MEKKQLDKSCRAIHFWNYLSKLNYKQKILIILSFYHKTSMSLIFYYGKKIQ